MFFKKLILAISIFVFTASTFAGIPGYVTDSNGKLVRDTINHHCVKTGTWELKNLIPECDTTRRAEVILGIIAPQPKAQEEVVVVTKPLAQPVVIVSEPLVLEKSVALVLNAAVLFDFDKSTLTVVGKDALNSVVEALKTAEYKTINLDGYTDRIGTVQYNLKLSQKRSNAVKAYLVANGIDAAKIKSNGHGKTKFRTTSTDCKNLKGAKLKACYSNDRRVELTLE